jgi:hypothetical protein
MKEGDGNDDDDDDDDNSVESYGNMTFNFVRLKGGIKGKVAPVLN